MEVDLITLQSEELCRREVDSIVPDSKNLRDMMVAIQMNFIPDLTEKIYPFMENKKEEDIPEFLKE